MKKLILIFLLNVSITHGSEYYFSDFNTSRFAKVISLGNAYTGYAQGVETTFYNSAGIAEIDHYQAIYSNGHGFAFIINDYTATDVALVIPTFQNIGTFAFSLNRLNIPFQTNGDYNQSIYQLHYAKLLTKDFSMGVGLNYYSISYNQYTDPSGITISDEVNGRAFDFNISFLYKTPVQLLSNLNDQIKIGSQFKNILNSKVSIDKFKINDLKFQSFRTGISYSVSPEFPKVLGLVPFRFLFVFDAVFYGSKYEFKIWQPNFGIELTLLENIFLRFGRENEKEIIEYYNYSPQHPVSRFGVGIKIPVKQLLNFPDRFDFHFDYSYSDWDKIEEDKRGSFIINDNDVVNQHAFSLKGVVNL